MGRMMRHQGTRTKVLDRLLASLAEAEQGSRELDIIISFVLGSTSGEAGKMVELLVDEGYPWDIVSELLDHDLPAYTTSLDAALPGENIVLSVYSTRRGLWGAAHRTAERQHVMRWAATECLARRLAALAALIPDSAVHDTGPAAAYESEPVDLVETGEADTVADAVDMPADADAPAHEDDEETEWKILF